MGPLTFRLWTGPSGEVQLAVIRTADRRTLRFVICLEDGTHVEVNAKSLTDPALTTAQFIAWDAANSRGHKPVSWFLRLGYDQYTAYLAHALYLAATGIAPHLFRLNRDRVLFAAHCLDAGRSGEIALMDAAQTPDTIAAAVEAHNVVAAANSLFVLSCFN